MKDESVIRCITILGGVALLIAAGVAGADGEMHTIGYALLGFGVGSGFGVTIAKKASKDV